MDHAGIPSGDAPRLLANPVSTETTEGYELGPRSIDTGCQRWSPEAGSTVGFTHDIGQRPDSTRATS